MTRLEEVGRLDAWRCWLCDEPVDPSMSVNDARGPSIDACTTKAKTKARTKASGRDATRERLAHRSCNTGKGGTAPVVPWPDHLFVVEPAVIIASVDRLERKGGREIMARCPTRDDAAEAATWLAGRVARLQPGLAVTAEVEAAGGQFVVVLHA